LENLGHPPEKIEGGRDLIEQGGVAVPCYCRTVFGRYSNKTFVRLPSIVTDVLHLKAHVG
jgi:hypothetical protein